MARPGVEVGLVDVVVAVSQLATGNMIKMGEKLTSGSGSRGGC